MTFYCVCEDPFFQSKLAVFPFSSSIEVLCCCSLFQVVQSCISCLGAVVNKVTHNIRLVKDYFQKYHGKFTANKEERIKLTHRES